MELSDFNIGGVAGITPEDFQNGRASLGKILSSTSVASVAGSMAYLEGDLSAENYDSLRDTLSRPDGRKLYYDRQLAVKDRLMAESQTEVQKVILDPTIPDDQKISFVDAANKAKAVYNPSSMRMVAEEGLLMDSNPTPSLNEADARSLMVDVIQPVIDHKRRMTAAINAIKLGKNPSTVGTIVDVGELFVPFAEWLHYDQLQSELTPDDKQSFWLGNQKKAIFENMKGKPLAEREQMLSTILSVLEDNENVVLPDGNDILTMEALEKIFIDSDYSSFERYFDNITSLIDVVGLAGAVRGITKGGRGIKAVEEMSDASKALDGEILDPEVPKSPVGQTDNLIDDPAMQARDVTNGRPPKALPNPVKKLPAPEPSPVEREALHYSTVTSVEPSSPAQILKDVNPEQARLVTQALEEAADDVIANATHGTNRTEALAKDTLPEPDLDGSIPNKPVLNERAKPQFQETDEVKRVRSMDGEAYLTSGEAARMQDRVVKSLEDVSGMIPHKESLTLRINTDGSTTYRMRYGFKDSGFVHPQDAVDSASFYFRHLGLTEKDFTLYARNGDKWKEVSMKEAKALKALSDEAAISGQQLPARLKVTDYSVGVTYNYRFNPQDMDVYDLLTVKRNFLDRLPPALAKTGAGSVQQHAVPATMSLPTQITLPALALTDRATKLQKVLIEEFNKFSREYTRLPTDRRSAMRAYIEEANLNKTPLRTTDLLARGFNRKEIDTLKQWRRANDNMYYLANHDMSLSLRNKGFQVYRDSNGTHLIVKPSHRNSVSSATEAYDPISNSVSKMLKDDLDTFYAGGGTYAKLSQPVYINGQWVEYVKAAQTQAGGYTRSIQPGETVLAYTDGYYPVMYDANFFIEKKVTINGEDKWIVVGSSKLKGDSDQMIKNLSQANPGDVYRPRADKFRPGEQDRGVTESGWALGQASGLTNQRVRGQRLADITSNGMNVGHTNLLDPLEAVGAQVRRLSERVVTRNYIDTVKARWVDNYFDALGLERNKYGDKWFPDHISQIKAPSNTPSKTVADARTIYGHIHGLENGFVNHIDEVYKATLHTLADLASDYKVTVGEKALRSVAKGADPTAAAKGLVFKLSLAANPLRQLVIQPSQAIQLLAINAKYMLGRSGLVADLIGLQRVRYGLSKDPKYVRMLDEIVNSGIIESVDHNNLVRREAIHLADESTSGRVTRAVGFPLRAAQRYGFDKGEQSINILSWLAHYNKMIDDGVKPTRRALDEMAGKARAFTGSMNKAGDVPYQTNSLALIFQFMQVPHKMFMAPFFERSLSRYDRVKLMGLNLIMYGAPISVLAAMGFDETDPTVKDINDGLIDVMLNKMFTTISGEKQEIDFSDLNPTEAWGTYDLIASLLTTDPATILANTPTGRLLFGGNARLTNFAKTLASWVNPFDDYEDPDLNVRFGDVVTSAANMFSGFSNAFKAQYAWQVGKKMSSYGTVTDDDVTKWEAAAQLFGFRTKTESAGQQVKEQLFGDYAGSKGDLESDIKQWVSQFKRLFASRGQSIGDNDNYQRVLAEGWRVFKEHEWQARRILFDVLEQDRRAGDYTLFETIRKQIGLRTYDEVHKMISVMPESEEKRFLVKELEDWQQTADQVDKEK